MAPYGFIVVGSLVFLIAFFGCCGAIRESHCMVSTVSFWHSMLCSIYIYAVYALLEHSKYYCMIMLCDVAADKHESHRNCVQTKEKTWRGDTLTYIPMGWLNSLAVVYWIATTYAMHTRAHPRIYTNVICWYAIICVCKKKSLWMKICAQYICTQYCLYRASAWCIGYVCRWYCCCEGLAPFFPARFVCLNCRPAGMLFLFEQLYQSGFCSAALPKYNPRTYFYVFFFFVLTFSYSTHHSCSLSS